MQKKVEIFIAIFIIVCITTPIFAADVNELQNQKSEIQEQLNQTNEELNNVNEDLTENLRSEEHTS